MHGARAILAIWAVSLPSGSMAQDMSDEELLKLFQAQRDAYRAAQSGDLGLTRGLTLITADDVVVTTEPPTVDAIETDTADTATVTDDGTVVVATEPTEAQTSDGEVVALASTGPTVLVQIPQDLQVNVRIEFEFDSAALTPEQRPKLQQLCKVMTEADIQLFRIVGHTDASGTPEYNERLSLLRAQEVQRYFINDCGVEASRLEAVGLGERFLLDSADPRGVENRRVEFQALS
jgi:outer membrane protein OmpA-like peptidoglycan-associated protein